LNEREKTHGSFKRTANTAQLIKMTIRNGTLSPLSQSQKESLDLIATKIARIVSGDPDDPDHWRDIEGYSRLARKQLED
jgi:hypothetical protein